MAVLIYIIFAALLGSSSAGGAIEKGLSDHLKGTLGNNAKIKVDVDRGKNALFSKSVNEIKLDMADFKLKDSGGAETILFRPGKKAVGARIRRISVTARNFEVMGLPVREMKAQINGLKYNLWKAATKRQLEILDVGPCSGEVTLTERGINTFAVPKIKELTNCKITLLKGNLRVSGWYKTKVGVAAPVSLTASLQPRRGQIHLINPHLKASVVPLPTFLAERVVKQINPVIDLNEGSQLPCSINITHVRIQPSGIWAKAAIDLKRPVAVPSAKQSNSTLTALVSQAA